jgi:hypothetical protein
MEFCPQQRHSGVSRSTLIVEVQSEPGVPQEGRPAGAPLASLPVLVAEPPRESVRRESLKTVEYVPAEGQQPGCGGESKMAEPVRPATGQTEQVLVAPEG